MYNKTLYVALIALLILQVSVAGKKSRRIKRPKDEEDATLQPSVVSYSTFGFNDVGSYDGFVPTSPDYANYLTNVNQETATRLYAPAFPTALDTTGYENNYGSQTEGHSVGSSDDGGPQSNVMQYSQNVNFFNSPSFDNSDSQHTKLSSIEVQGHNTDDINAPVYGTKLGSKNKKHTNNTDFSLFHAGKLVNPSEFKLNFNLQHNEQPSSSENKPYYGESTNHFHNTPSGIGTYPPVDVEDYVKPAPSNAHNFLKFPKVIDFTKMNFPHEVESKYPRVSFDSIKSSHTENIIKNNNDNPNSKFINHPSIFKDSSTLNSKHIDENKDKQRPKQSSYISSDYNYINTPSPKNIFKSTGIKSDPNDNNKSKFLSGNNSNDLKHWNNPTKGYEYSTNYSSTSFKYDYEEPKKQLNDYLDEIIPASSNTVDLTNHQLLDNEYPSSFKKIPDFKTFYDSDFGNGKTKEKFKPDEYLNNFKNLYNNVPTATATSQWGNVLKASDFSSHKYHPRKPYTDETNIDIVHIPKKPHSTYHFGKHFDNTPSITEDLFSSLKSRPHNSKYKLPKDWSFETYNNKFKTEEDLLGLRNHDTSNPSYLPTYRPYDNELSDDNDYKKLVEKWRQSYWKAKFRDSHPDIDSYATEPKPHHVPIPKPYPIEVPHPVIVPVPQPYPVRVPVPKPVAVPVVREITIPIEKPVPYPVVKKVPFPVEKPVPVPVEKEASGDDPLMLGVRRTLRAQGRRGSDVNVAVPVVKPYPVHIPHVRPVFHNSRPPRDEYESDNSADEDDDYFPRPEGGKKIVSYRKRPTSTRTRQRRPTRTNYQDRNTRRRVPRRPTDPYTRRPYSTHIDFHYSAPYRFKDIDADFEADPSDYISYCKRTRNC